MQTEPGSIVARLGGRPRALRLDFGALRRFERTTGLPALNPATWSNPTASTSTAFAWSAAVAAAEAPYLLEGRYPPRDLVEGLNTFRARLQLSDRQALDLAIAALFESAFPTLDRSAEAGSAPSSDTADPLSLDFVEPFARYDLRLGPLEWLTLTPKALHALAERRRLDVHAADYRAALVASVVVTAFTGRTVLPGEFLGEGPTAPAVEPGSTAETKHFLTAMGATRAPKPDSLSA